MTDHEFRDLVRAMRVIQKQFFRTRAADRPPDLIRQAKAYELLVDDELAETTRSRFPLLDPDDR